MGRDEEVRTEDVTIKCPICGTVVDGALMIAGVNVPTERLMPGPGDLSICVYCFAVSVFTDQGQLRTATAKECEEIPESVLKLIGTLPMGRKPS